MSRFGTDYPVSRPTGVCAVTERAFEAGETCIATLCEREGDEGFERLDFAVEAWDAGERPERLFSFWRCIVPDREAKQSMLVDDAVLMDLFERLASDERPKRIAFRFVLGLILMRKRQLRYIGRRDATADTQEFWLLKARGSDPEQPPFEVANPNLADDDVRELTAQLSEVLAGEL